MREVLGLDPVTDPKRIAAIRDAVALNAAAALAVETAARGQAPRDGRTADRIGDWFQPACDALTSGAAGAVLTSFIATTQRLRGTSAADEQG
jgi:anthranilate phosphoribosyltransferase